ncbi:MAG: lysylphosphatidylglycerol synthase domain-containing protein, partial [Solirubrobacteraceae bacterium]
MAASRRRPRGDAPAAKPRGWGARAEQRDDLGHARGRGIRRRILTLCIAAVVLYGVAPAVLEVLGAYRRLTDVDPAWWIALVAMSVAGTWCMCAVQRRALNGARWFPVVTSQIAGAAFSKVVPGGSAAAAALQARMLTQSGLPPAAVGTGLTAGALLLLGALAGLPLLALPAVLMGRRIPDGLLQAAGVGLVVFAVLFAVGALLLVNDRVLRAVGRGLRAADLRLHRGQARSDRLPERLFDERDLLRTSLGGAWVQAVALAAGRWIFDFLSLYAALLAVGARPPLYV